LQTAIRKLEQSGVAPNVIEKLTDHAFKLERAAGETRIASSIESAVTGVKGSLDDIARATDDLGKQFAKGSDEAVAIQQFRKAADDFAQGVGSEEKLAEALTGLRRFESIPPATVEQLAQKAVTLSDDMAKLKVFTHVDQAMAPVRQAANVLDDVLKAGTAPADDIARAREVVRDFASGKATVKELDEALAKVGGGGTVESARNTLVSTVKEAGPAIKIEQGLTATRQTLDDAANITDDIARRYAPGTTQHKAVQEVQAAFESAAKGTMTSDELAQVVAKHARTLDNVKPGAAEALTQNAYKLADNVADTSRLMAIRSGADDIARLSDDLVKGVPQGAQRTAVQSLKETAEQFAKGNKSIDDVKAALDDVRKSGVTGEKFQEIAQKVGVTDRLVVVENGVQTARQLTRELKTHLDDLEVVARGDQAAMNALRDVRQSLRRAEQTGVTDDLVNAIQRNEQTLKALDKKVATSYDNLAQSARSLTDDLGNLARKDVAVSRFNRHLDDLEKAAGADQAALKAVKEVRDALTRAEKSGATDDLVRTIERNQTALKGLDAKVATNFDNFAQNIKVLSDDLGRAATKNEAVDRFSRNLDELERAAVGNPAATTALKEVREALKRAEQTGAADDLAQTIQRNQGALKQLDTKAAGSFDNLTQSARNLSDDFGRIARKEEAVANFSRNLDELEKAAVGNTQAATAIKEVREALKRAEQTGVTDDVVRAIERNQPALKQLDEKVAGSFDNLTQSAKSLSDDLGRVATREQAVARFSRNLDELEKAAVGNPAATTAVKEVREALKRVEQTGVTDDLAQTIQRNQAALKQLDAKVAGSFDDLTRSTRTLSDDLGRIARKYEAIARVSRNLDDLEKAAAGDQAATAAVKEVREALKRAEQTGVTDDLAQTLQRNQTVLRELDKKLASSYDSMVSSAKSLGDDLTKATKGQSLARFNHHLDDLERLARNDANATSAVREIREAVRRAEQAGTGVSDDLIKTVQKHEQVLKNLESRVPKYETVLTNATKYGDELANVRKVSAVDNSVNAARSTVDDLIRSAKDPARATEFTSAAGRQKLVDDLRNIANKMDDASEGAAKTRIRQLADDIEKRPGTVNHVEERLKAIRQLSDDVAGGTASQQHLRNFVNASRTHLDDLKPGAAKTVETRIADVADARKLVVVENTSKQAQTIVHQFGDDVKHLTTTNAAIRAAVNEVDDVAKRYVRGEATTKEFSEAVDRFAKIRQTEDAASAQLLGLEQRARQVQKAFDDLHVARADVFESQFNKLTANLNRGANASTKEALESLSRMSAVATPEVRTLINKLRDNILDQQAMYTVINQGFSGDKTLSRALAGDATAAQSLVARTADGAINTRPVMGIVTDRTQLYDAIERIARRHEEIAASKYGSGSVAGLTTDPVALIADNSLKIEAARRQLISDIAWGAAGVGLTYRTADVLKDKAEDAVRREKLAPIVIAELMDREVKAQNDTERRQIRERLSAVVAEAIAGKSDGEIAELRTKVEEIINRRAQEDTNTQAVWRRRQEEAALSPALQDAASRARQRAMATPGIYQSFEPSIDEIKAEKRHYNQNNYGNPMGWLRGVPDPVVVESVQPVFPVQQFRRAGNTQIPEQSDKGKPGTTGFDFGKIRNMTDNYSPQGLRSNPFGNPLAAQASALGWYGTVKPWQSSMVSGSAPVRRHVISSENAGRNLYGRFEDIEEPDEKDKPGVAPGGAVTASQNDPTQTQTVAAQLMQAATSTTGANTQDEESV
ncbi:MAG TPA: hypothetical protein V6D17_13040, partial [Candidatus Obscuribacterales bacterium]